MGEDVKVDERTIRVVQREFPDQERVCALCGSALVEKLIPYQLERDYNDVQAIVTLEDLPVLYCDNCKNDWVLEWILKAYENKVKLAFEEMLANSREASA